MKKEHVLVSLCVGMQFFGIVRVNFHVDPQTENRELEVDCSIVSPHTY